MIPLALLVGFLGAGKTRFLTQLLPELHARGLRPRVILNDFANASIDASRLAELDALVTPLNGECVCCTSLRELMDALLAVQGRPGDVMLIEANGATEADELLGVLTMDRRLVQYTLPLQLTVLDVSRWQKRWFHNGLEAAQSRTATHLHLNWTDGLRATRLDAATQSIRTVNPRATFTDPAQFAEDLLAISVGHAGDAQRPAPESAAQSVARVRTHAAHEHPFASGTLALPPLVDRSQFTAFVRDLPNAVVRAKGLVRFSDAPSAMFVWNRIGGRRLMSLDASSPHATALPVALFIGVDLPMDELQRQVGQLHE